MCVLLGGREGCVVLCGDGGSEGDGSGFGDSLPPLLQHLQERVSADAGSDATGPLLSLLFRAGLQGEVGEKGMRGGWQKLAVWCPHLHAVVEVSSLHHFVVCPLCFAGLDECACP